MTLTDAATLDRRRWLQSTLAAACLVVARASRAEPAPPHAATRGPHPAPIQLSLNENPFGPSPRALAAIQAHLTGLSRYTAVDADQLVAEIAAREQLAPEQVMLGEVLDALGRELAQRGGPGGEFIYSDPGYTALIDAAQLGGGVGVPVPLDAELRNDLGALRARLNPHTRAAFLVNPHNPSGTLNESAALHGFIREAAQRSTVIVDEAYLEFTPDSAARSAALDLRANANVVVFRTFTKFHGLAALPLGYALLPMDLAAALRKKGLGAARSQNRLAVIAARASLGDDAYAERVRRSVSVERARWFRVLKELGLRFSDAHGNFVFFETRRPHAEVAAAFLTQGIDIGRAFPPLDRWARISIGLPAENARAQAALRRILEH